MIVRLHRSFEKAYVKLPKKVKLQSKARIALFVEDPDNRTLRNHSLKAKYIGYRSIDITGDYRAIYKLVDPETALFTHIGTHSQLYK